MNARVEWRNGARVTSAWGHVIAYRALCPDGRWRVTAWVAESPDSFSSHAAVMRVGRVRVRGFISVRDDGGHAFTPYVDSPRPAAWSYDLGALDRARVDAWHQARQYAHDARTAPARRRRYGPPSRAMYLRWARAERERARALGRALDVAHAHEVARYYATPRDAWGELQRVRDAVSAVLLPTLQRIATVTDGRVCVWLPYWIGPRVVRDVLGAAYVVGPVRRDASGAFVEVAPTAR